MERIAMNVLGIISKKREGLPLDEAEIRFLVEGLCAHRIPDYQVASFLMAAVIRGMSLDETVALTRIMMESGRTFRFDAAPGPVMDKHSTGGVGDKISIPLVPIAVECGLAVPMISGRALGHTGGTLDKLESIPGMRTSLTPREFERQVIELGACFGAQTDDVVPADRALYALRDASGTIESVPLIVSSILSKKFAEGVRGVVIDVKCGRGAFMRTLPDARELARVLGDVGTAMGIPVKTIITAMDEPLGAAVGNALEIEESIRILEGAGPAEVVLLTLRLVSEMLLLAGLVPSIAAGEALARRAIESGQAMKRFERIVAAQGGRLDRNAPRFGLPASKTILPIESAEAGFVAEIDARVVGETVRQMGGGRFRKGDAVDPSVGIVFRKKRGDEIARGEPLLEIHASTEESARAAASRLSASIRISREPVERPALVLCESMS
jgi:pyrimidine-nucleoside phosphorylase